MPPPPRSYRTRGTGGLFRFLVRSAAMPDVQDERERTLHDLAVPEMVRLVRRVFPSLLLVVPDLGAQFLGVLFKLPAVIGVEVERAGVIRVDAELERQNRT